MRGIAKLLLGEDAGSVLDFLGGDDADGFGLADRARRSGEWCGSTPGRGRSAAVARGAARPDGPRRGMIAREFRIR